MKKRNKNYRKLFFHKTDIVKVFFYSFADLPKFIQVSKLLTMHKKTKIFSHYYCFCKKSTIFQLFFSFCHVDFFVVFVFRLYVCFVHIGAHWGKWDFYTMGGLKHRYLCKNKNGTEVSPLLAF